MSSNVFTNLISAYPTWAGLSAYLTSADGGSLRVDDHSTSMSPFALIRYTKGHSNMTLAHVRAFRSVVWNTLENRPVSVTSFKSHDGETLPDDQPIGTYEIEEFMDGVMIGMFWDKYNNMWRIHTRSTLDAQCRYFSQTTTFSTMFSEAIGAHRETMEKSLNANTSYTWILQHPMNRIVVPVPIPRAFCVQAVTIANNNEVTVSAVPAAAFPVSKVVLHSASWDLMRTTVVEWSRHFGHSIQGMVAKSGFDRYKIRTPAYNTTRRRRGNSARRDFLWLSEWRSGTLPAYISLFPEERSMANMTIARWKQATNEVYQWYVSVFKARNTHKQQIPPKYRPLVYGIHTLYMNTLKPAGKSVDWRTCLSFMNERDTAQMLFVINWDMRQTAKQLGLDTIPLEPSSTAVGTQVDGDISDEIGELTGPGTPSEVPPVSAVSAVSAGGDE